MKRLHFPFLLFFVCTNILGAVALSACDTNTPGTPTKPDNALEIIFAYSSEKKPWIEPLAAKFNSEHHTLPGDNRPIYIKAQVCGQRHGRAADRGQVAPTHRLVAVQLALEVRARTSRPTRS